MPFTRTKYEADSGEIHPIRLDDDRLSAAGTPPAGDITNDASVKISKSRREFGIRPRGVSLVRTRGSAPNQFKVYTFVPCLTETYYDGLAKGDSITVDSVSWEVANKIPEDND